MLLYEELQVYEYKFDCIKSLRLADLPFSEAFISHSLFLMTRSLTLFRPVSERYSEKKVWPKT